MKYNPISCSLYDRIESLAVQKRNLKIIFFDNENNELKLTVFIENIFSSKGAEYIKFSNQNIRLDLIKSISEFEG